MSPLTSQQLLALALARQEAGRLDEAEALYRAALESDPADAIAHNNLGNLLREAGRVGEAIESYRRALALVPARAEIHSNLIFAMQADPAADAKSIAAECRRWCERHAEPQCAPHANSRDPERRMRIGFVSPDLHDHPVGRTLLPVFEALDPAAVALVCYSDLCGADGVTMRFKAKAERWRETARMTDDELTRVIRGDEIDILFDLAQHTAFNRLTLFARKPAPVQVSWLGCPGSAGLDTIDYTLSDPQLDPTGVDDGFPGKSWRLPDAWCCYSAPNGSPEPNVLPALRAGGVTFGSCNSLAKLSEPAVAAWAEVLRSVEGSRLCLLAKAEEHQRRVRALFARHGIAMERIAFFPYVPLAEGECAPHGEYLLRYHDIDIALDPFPYNGMTTTGDALWMGVPVIALAGERPVFRASFSMLKTIGLAGLAARSEAEYVRLATSLARDLPRLAGLRATLRGQMMRSPLMDTRRFARNLEEALRGMWRRWCERPLDCISRG